MALETKADDWQVCLLMQVAAATGIGAGLYSFCFTSEKANISALMSFKGAGLGEGGDASGFVMPHDFGDISSPWTKLECSKAFSVWNLNGAWGRLTTLGGGIGVQYSLMYITAAPPWSISDNYFASQSVGGYGFGGAGAGGLTLIGNWRFKKVIGLKPSNAAGPANMMA